MVDDSHEPNSDWDVAAVIEEFGGDPRAAIRALLHDLDVLARDYDASVSRGFVRRQTTSRLRMIYVRRITSS